MLHGTFSRRAERLAPIRYASCAHLAKRRLLFERLLDMTISPAAERRRVARETDLALRAGNSPSQGPENAQVTLTEFSDFQCPFCKRFTDFLDRLPDRDHQGVRILFKHRPLTMHAWARRAALASICASFESNEAFWSLEKFFFANQDAITPTNLEDKIAAFARESGGFDFGRVHNCLEEEAASKILLRDESWRSYTTLTLYRRFLSTEPEVLASDRLKNFEPFCTRLW